MRFIVTNYTVVPRRDFCARSGTCNLSPPPLQRHGRETFILARQPGKDCAVLSLYVGAAPS